MNRALRTVVISTLLACAVGLSACARDEDEFVETHKIDFSLNVDEAEKIAGVAKAATSDPFFWTVHCVSLDEQGVKTTNTAIFDEGRGVYEITDIPDDVDTVCQLVDEKERLITTIAIGDSGSLGGSRDIFKLTRSTQATIVYSEALDSSLAHGGGFKFGDSEGRADLEGKWGIGCREVRDMVTDEPEEEVSCSDEVEEGELFLDRIDARDSFGDFRMAYGIWSSESAYRRCGLKEGLDALPFGWSLDEVSSARSGPFTWDAPFVNLTAGTPSNEIMEMIRANGAEGLPSYADFKIDNPDICEDEDGCTVWYYYAMRDYGAEHADALCWPMIAFSFSDDDEAIASLWPSSGGRSKPLGRHHLLEAFEYGNETYMRSHISQVRRVYGENVGVVNCKTKEEFLMAVELPDSNEDGHAYIDEDDGVIKSDDDLISTGTRLDAKYHLSTEVVSVDGMHDNLCQQELGDQNSFDDTNVYSDIVLESITAE